MSENLYHLCQDLSKLNDILLQKEKEKNENNKKYIVVKGHVQSGKSRFMICASHYFIEKGLSVVILLRNMREDRLQLYNRFVQFDDSHRSILPPHRLVKNVKNKKKKNIPGIYFPLGNYASIETMNKHSLTDYVLFIDEVDSVDSGGSSKKAEPLRLLKDGAKYIFGVSATTMDPFGKEDVSINDVILLTPPSSYKGIINKGVNMVPIDKKCKFTGKTNANLFETDTGLHSFLEQFKDAPPLSSQPRICLVNICDAIQPCFDAQERIGEMFPSITTIVYNSKGTRIKKGDQILNDGNQSISASLQWIKDSNYDNPIVIFSGELAGRGISFVSSDFTWHLTEQRLLISNTCSEADLIQKIRLCGVYHDDSPLTLYTTQAIIDDLVKASFRQEEYIFEMSEKMNDDKNDNNKTCKELIEETEISKDKLTKRKMTKDKSISFHLNIVQNDRRWSIQTYKKYTTPRDVYKMYKMDKNSNNENENKNEMFEMFEEKKEDKQDEEDDKEEKEKKMILTLSRKLSSDKATKESTFLAMVDINYSYTKEELCELLRQATYEQPKSMFNAVTSTQSKWGKQYFEMVDDNNNNTKNTKRYKIKESLKVCWQ